MKPYSDWFKVDLHIHTDYSKKTKQGDYEGTFDIAVLKRKLVDNEVKLFSLTDHNIINVGAYENYYDDYTVGDPLLLIGCEFDIEVVQNDGSSQTYHSLLIFNKNDKQSVNEISKKIEELFIGTPDFERKISLDNLLNSFNGEDFFFIPHAGSNKSIISPYRGNIPEAQRMILLMQSPLEKVKEQARQHYNLEFDRLKNLDFQDKEDVPYINFSDNHNCSKYPCTNKDGDDHNFYCIKGIPSYEALRFAFIDPTSRIKKLEDIIALSNSRKFIEKIKIESNPQIDDVEIEMSPNLNVIIGGRSSGKSLLFNVIGSKAGINKNNLEKYNFEGDTAEIKTSLDADYKKNVTFNNGEIIYINQGDIVNFFENDALIELAEESGKKNDYEKAFERFELFKQEFTDKITEFRKAYSELKDSNEGNFIMHSSDIERILDSSYIFKNNFSISDSSLLLEDAKKNIEDLKVKVDFFRNKSQITFSASDLVIIEEFEKLIELKIKELDTKKIIYTIQNKLLQNFNNIIKEKNATLNIKSRDKEQANERLENLKNNIAIAFSKSFHLNSISIEVENLQYEHQEIVQINDEVSIVLEIENEDNVKNLIFDGIKESKIEASLYDNMLMLVRGETSIKNYNDNSVESLRKKLGVQLDVILKKFDKPKDFLKYSAGESSKNNSPGYNSEKYIETVLKDGISDIVFIDQPEDNLGNKYIIDNLINLLRKIKFEKQIILVTHNPSIVVYGDAENIVLAENNNNKIKYTQMVLEDPSSQREICKVLDGGEYIFNMRSQKYNVKKLLN